MIVIFTSASYHATFQPTVPRCQQFCYNWRSLCFVCTFAVKYFAKKGEVGQFRRERAQPKLLELTLLVNDLQCSWINLHKQCKFLKYNEVIQLKYSEWGWERDSQVYVNGTANSINVLELQWSSCRAVSSLQKDEKAADRKIRALDWIIKFRVMAEYNFSANIQYCLQLYLNPCVPLSLLRATGRKLAFPLHYELSWDLGPQLDYWYASLHNWIKNNMDLWQLVLFMK